MKLSDLDINAASKLRESSNFAVREIKKVCKNIGPRAPGTDKENEAQDYIVKNCARFADTVEKENFKLSPRAFLAWPWLASILVFTSVCLFQISKAGLFGLSPAVYKAFDVVSLCLVVLVLIFVVFEFLFYKKLLDPFFRKSTSSNVILTKKPTGEVKRRIIFGGHIDSSYEWSFTYWGGAKLITSVIASAVAALVMCLVITVLNVAGVLDGGWLLLLCRILMGVAAAVCFVGIFFENGKVVVEGANDNLTGVFGSIAVLQFMKENNIRFENTEVVAISTGAEESGLRGAKAYVKAHADELNKVETVFVGIDTLRDYDHMGVYNRDMTGTTKLDPQAAALLKEGSDLSGLDLEYKVCFLGSSDSAAMQQGGVRSVTLAAMDPAPARYYHTRLDTADNLDPRTIEKGIEVLINTAMLFDEQGLRDSY
ncbi:MAG: M28 family metallopeptidase [Oscillospiraceae bacterium]|nr:M28 family metallopeptidase [Oscillospiraceae bacterium]